MNRYGQVTAEIAKELETIVGGRNVIFGESDRLEPYSHDEVAQKEYWHFPEAVVKPNSPEEISSILRLANRELIPVTPRGAGSGLSCGAVPVFGGIVLSLERMNRILEIDEANMVAVVEPGVVTNELNRALEPKGLFYAGYPMSLETCFIGGNVAENAGGGKAVKYGVTGRYVLGLEVVLPTGEVVPIGGKRVKDVTGYDLVHLLVGSEGTLGIFTKIFLKLLPLPRATCDLLVLFPDVPSAIAVVPVMMTEARIIPTSVEFMDRLSFQTGCRHLNEYIDYKDAGASLLIEVDGQSKEEVEEQYFRIGELCEERGALEVYVADNLTTRERIWNIRRKIPEAFKVENPHQSPEDIVVPIAEIPALMPELERIGKEFGVRIPCFGHAGDGNLHATVVKEPSDSLEEWQKKLPKVLRELYIVAARLGGTISGEHGIGSKRKDYLPLVLDSTLISLMKRVKQAFDPNGIMNPGKIFPEPEE